MTDYQFSAELLRLCGKLRDQNLNEGEAHRLNELLITHPEARQFFLRFMSLTSALETQLSADSSNQHDLNSDSQIGLMLELLQLEDAAKGEIQPQPEAIELDFEAETINTSDVFKLISDPDVVKEVAGIVLRSKPVRWLACAAAILLGVFLLVVFSGTNDRDATPPITQAPSTDNEAQVAAQPVLATLSAEHGARWLEDSGGTKPQVGDTLKANHRLVLIDGFAEVVTETGARILLEGPCQIQTSDRPDTLELIQGKLVGICETEPSKGLVIRTPSVDITDLGTRFGIDLNEQGVVNTAVFDGEVVLAPASDLQSQAETVHLKAGQAISADQAGRIDAHPHELKPDHGFLPSWRDIIGRALVTGQARFFVEPPADISPNALVDPDHMIVFQEQTAVTEAPIQVMTELSRTAGTPKRTQIPSGTRVTSYMIHFSPHTFTPGSDGEMRNKPPSTTVKAKIRFPGRVLGIIGGGKEMAKTHGLLGLDSVVYLDSNEKIYNNAVDGWPGDGFTISGEEQNILDIHLSALVHSDQARILIEAPTN